MREDIPNIEQRPKLGDYPDYVYLLVKLLQDGAGTNDIRAEQLSLILGADFVPCF